MAVWNMALNEKTMYVAFLGSVLAAFVMEFWWQFLLHHPALTGGTGDNIGRWWAVNAVPWFIGVEGLAMIAVATRTVALAGNGQRKVAVGLAFLAVSIVVFFSVAMVSSGTSLVALVVGGWPVDVWTCLIFAYGVRLIRSK